MNEFAKLIRNIKAEEIFLNSFHIENIEFSCEGVKIIGEVTSEELAEESAKALFECFVLDGQLFTDGTPMKVERDACFSAPEYPEALLLAAKNLAKLGIINMKEVKKVQPLLETKEAQLYMGIQYSWVKTGNGVFSLPPREIGYIAGIVVESESVQRAVKDFAFTLGGLEKEAIRRYEMMGETPERERYFIDRSNTVLRNLPAPGICLKTANARVKTDEKRALVITSEPITEIGASRRLGAYKHSIQVVHSSNPNETMEEIKKIAPSARAILLPVAEKKKKTTKKTVRDLDGRAMSDKYEVFVKKTTNNSVLLNGATVPCSLEQIKNALIYLGVISDEVAVLPPKSRPRKGTVDLGSIFKTFWMTAPQSVLEILKEIEESKQYRDIWSYLAPRWRFIDNSKWKLLAMDAGKAITLYRLGYRSGIKEVPHRTFPEQVLLAASYTIDISNHRWLLDSNF